MLEDKAALNLIDGRWLGPKLFCEYCKESKVLSPCFFCQSMARKGYELNKIYCRGCGSLLQGFKPCASHKNEFGICEISRRKKLLLRIDEITSKKGTLALFRDWGLRRLPAEIGLLTTVKFLHLEDNLLKELPQEICQLTNLQRLYLGDNLLEKLPQEIHQLVNLEKLFLKKNKLSRKEFKNLKKALPKTQIIK